MEMEIYIFNYKDVDGNALNEMHGHLNVLNAIECEFLMEFDFYNVGTIETNIIMLNSNLFAIIVSYDIETFLNPMDEKLEDIIPWISSVMVNIEYFIPIKDIIKF